MKIEKVEPVFLKMGEKDLINLNNVNHIKMKKVLATDKGTDEITFVLAGSEPVSFAIKDCEAILTLVKVPYTLGTL